MKVKIEIKSIFGRVLFSYESEDNTIAKTVTEAVKSGADLSGADLSGADLRRADLRGADLSRADLRRADLRGADLSRADLRRADLRRADLRRADLRRADLSDIKNDFWDVLLRAQKEIPGLKTAVQEGKINGSVYSGECACLVGTIANIRHCDYHDLGTITPNSSRPIERFFLGLKEGDTPENNQIAKIVLEWIEEFQTLTAA